MLLVAINDRKVSQKSDAYTPSFPLLRRVPALQSTGRHGMRESCVLKANASSSVLVLQEASAMPTLQGTL